MTDQNFSSPYGATPHPHIPDPRDPANPADQEALLKMQEALQAAQDASSKLARATQDASTALESYSRETQEVLEQRAKKLLAAIEAEEAAKKRAPVETEVSSSTGQLYFTTTISNIEPPKPAPEPAPIPATPTPAPPVQQPATTVYYPAVPPAPPAPETQQIFSSPLHQVSTSPVDDSGLDVDTSPVEPSYTDPAQFSQSGFFTEGTTTSLDMAQDFGALALPSPKPTPKIPYFVYLILGSIGAIAASWLVFTVPATTTLEQSSVFLPLIIAAIVFFALGLLMWLPIWLVSRGRTTNHSGLFARAFLRAALCTTLVTFLWVEALVISDMFRMGQLSL